MNYESYAPTSVYRHPSYGNGNAVWTIPNSVINAGSSNPTNVTTNSIDYDDIDGEGNDVRFLQRTIESLRKELDDLRETTDNDYAIAISMAAKERTRLDNQIRKLKQEKADLVAEKKLQQAHVNHLTNQLVLLLDRPAAVPGKERQSKKAKKEEVNVKEESNNIQNGEDKDGKTIDMKDFQQSFDTWLHTTRQGQQQQSDANQQRYHKQQQMESDDDSGKDDNQKHLSEVEETFQHLMMLMSPYLPSPPLEEEIEDETHHGASSTVEIPTPTLQVNDVASVASEKRSYDDDLLSLYTIDSSRHCQPGEIDNTNGEGALGIITNLNTFLSSSQHGGTTTTTTTKTIGVSKRPKLINDNDDANPQVSLIKEAIDRKKRRSSAPTSLWDNIFSKLMQPGEDEQLDFMWKEQRDDHQHQPPFEAHYLLPFGRSSMISVAS